MGRLAASSFISLWGSCDALIGVVGAFLARWGPVRDDVDGGRVERDEQHRHGVVSVAHGALL